MKERLVFLTIMGRMLWSLLMFLVMSYVNGRRNDYHVAVSKNSVLRAERTFEKNPNGIDEIDDRTGQTPLMYSVLSGQTDLVRFFLEKGADVTIPEKDGYTPVHGAGFQGRAEIMKILIDHGLDPSDRHGDGFTPLHRACWGREDRHTETVRVLLDAGVPVDQSDKNGRTCSSMTKNQNTLDLIKMHQHHHNSDGDL